MELTQFEQDLGLNEVKGTIIVDANIWSNNSDMLSIRVETTRRAFHNATLNNKRYSMDKMLDLMSKDNKSEGLKALVYRAKVSAEKDLPIRTKGAVHLGIIQA